MALPDAGLDPGLSAVLTDSFGVSYDTPKPLKTARLRLRRIQKAVSRKFEARKKAHQANLAATRATGSFSPLASELIPSLSTVPYSRRLRHSIRKLARAHTKAERIRDDAAKKTARRIERRFSRIAVEEHGLGFIVKNRHLAKVGADVAIGKQKATLRSALGRGRYFEASNRRQEGGIARHAAAGQRFRRPSVNAITPVRSVV